jgi:hypothetical protein
MLAEAARRFRRGCDLLSLGDFGSIICTLRIVLIYN